MFRNTKIYAALMVAIIMVVAMATIVMASSETLPDATERGGRRERVSESVPDPEKPREPKTPVAPPPPSVIDETPDEEVEEPHEEEVAPELPTADEPPALVKVSVEPSPVVPPEPVQTTVPMESPPLDLGSERHLWGGGELVVVEGFTSTTTNLESHGPIIPVSSGKMPSPWFYAAVGAVGAFVLMNLYRWRSKLGRFIWGIVLFPKRIWILFMTGLRELGKRIGYLFLVLGKEREKEIKAAERKRKRAEAKAAAAVLVAAARAEDDEEEKKDDSSE